MPKRCSQFHAPSRKPRPVYVSGSKGANSNFGDHASPLATVEEAKRRGADPSDIVIVDPPLFETQSAAPSSAAIQMILTCPSCGARHVDKGEFATKPHHTHACQFCGMVWRPAIVPTVGVMFLPGFKDKE